MKLNGLILSSARMASTAARRAMDHKKFLPKLSGSCFALLDPSKKDLVPPHPLDTDREKYLRVLEQDLIPACQNIVPKSHKLHKRIGDLLSHINPAFDMGWNFGVELTYRIVAPEKDHTEENLRLMRILRGSMDMVYSWTVIMDDIADNSDIRRNKPTWHTFCDGGLVAAVYDTLFSSQVPAYSAITFFHDRPGYDLLLEAYCRSAINVSVGQNMDYLGMFNDGLQDYDSIVTFKTGKLMQLCPSLALIHAGILDRHILNQMELIWHQFGHIFQTWDDFTDYYSEPVKTEKPRNDGPNANTTWVSTVGNQTFNDQQKNIFKDCYGSSDPVKADRVRELLDEINLPMLYIDYLRNKWLYCSSLIEEIPDAKVREAAYAFMKWMIGGVEDV